VGQQLRQPPGHRGFHHQLAVLRSVPLRHLTRIGQLVELSFPEADGERPHGVSALQAHQGHDRTAVQPPAEEGPHGHVAHQVGTHRLPQPSPQLRHVLPQTPGRPLRGDEVPVALQPEAGTFQDQPVTRRQLPDAAKRGVRARDVPVREVQVQGLWLQLPPHVRELEERLELRRECDSVAPLLVVQGLDPEPVPREHEPLPRGVPQGEGKHPAQPPDTVHAEGLVRVHDHLGVRTGPEAVAAGLQLGAQLAEVVHLAVVHEPDRPVFVGHRLGATGRVDDPQPAHGQGHVRRLVIAFLVRPPVVQRPVHPAQHRPVRHKGRLQIYDTADPAHLRLTPRRGRAGAANRICSPR
jgi:hypothetical protein